MSRFVSRKHTKPPSGQRRTQPNASVTAPSSIPEFQTQESLNSNEWSHPDDPPSGVIEDTQPRVSGRRQASRSSQTVAARSPSPSHRSEERTERAEDHRQRPSSHNSSNSQATHLTIRSPHNEAKGKQAAAEHSSALDNTPPHELLAAQQDLLELWTKTKGLSEKVVHKGVIQATDDYFSNLKWGQSEPTRSQLEGSTTGLDKRPSGPNNHTSAHALDDTHGSQHESKSSRDAAGGMPLDREGAPSMLTAPDGEDSTERAVAVPANKKGKSKAASSLVVGDLTVLISCEEEFRDAFLAWHLKAIVAGGLAIDLFELAGETVRDVAPKFQQRLEDAIEQERQRKRRRIETRAQGKRKNPTRRLNTDEEVWQVLFTIIANMFVFGLKPLFTAVNAASRSPSNTAGGPVSEDPPATGRNTNLNECNRQNGGDLSNELAGCLSEDITKNMQKFTESMCWWQTADDPKQRRLEKVYKYHHKLETVRLYDWLMEAWKEDESIQRRVREEKGYKGQDAATCMLSCVWHLGKKNNNEDWEILPEDSEIIKGFSDKILGFRPICSLVDAFGKGILLLLINNAEKHVLGIVGDGQEHYPQHQRISDVALSLCNVDREKYGGELRKQFTKLEKVLGRILQIREGGNTGGLLLACPQSTSFDKTNIGKRISYILRCIDNMNDADLGKSREDEGSRRDGSAWETYLGEDIYSA